MGLFGPGFVWILHPNAGNIDLWVYYATIERLLMNRSGLALENNTNEWQKEFSYSTKTSHIAVMRIQLLPQAW